MHEQRTAATDPRIRQAVEGVTHVALILLDSELRLGSLHALKPCMYDIVNSHLRGEIPLVFVPG